MEEKNGRKEQVNPTVLWALYVWHVLRRYTNFAKDPCADARRLRLFRGALDVHAGTVAEWKLQHTHLLRLWL